MTETTTHLSRDPSGILLDLIVALLAPMFLGVTGGDIAFARLAAAATVNDYRARNHADLIAVAQIIGFGLAALGSLSLSLADEISIAMALRLRGNANACSRSAEQNRRAVANRDPAPNRDWNPPEPEIPDPFADHTDTDMFLSAAAAQQLAEEFRRSPATREQKSSPVAAPRVVPPVTEEKRHQEMWAIAMAKESADITATIPGLPPAQRKAATIRAAMLSSTAHNLIHGETPSPPRITRPRPTQTPA